MTATPKHSHRQDKATLATPSVAEEREVLQHWQMAGGGMDGPRGMLPPPDDEVAYRLLDAAGTAMSRGDWQKGVNILKLVVRDYRQSQEAACARSVIDRLADRGRG